MAILVAIVPSSEHGLDGGTVESEQFSRIKPGVPHLENRDDKGGDAGRLPVTGRRSGAEAFGAFALGALACGAVALGALAIGRMAVGSLAVGRSRVRRLEIEELDVGRLRVKELDVVGEGNSSTHRSNRR